MNKNVLVVDDEPAIREKLTSIFEKEGYRVFSAESAEDGLELLQQWNIQVMFLDLNLPGMNGLDLCRTIRKTNPVACLFAVTGYQSLFELADCREAGFDDYFTKPVKARLLTGAARSAFDRLARWTKR